MKKKNHLPEDAVRLRQKAEEQLKLRKSKTNKIASEFAALKLIHELEIYHIELEIQNEELVIAKEKAEQAGNKYTELYDFAPFGYLSVSKEGDILELNFAAARMLGKDRSKLIKTRLALFISEETLPVFNLFFQHIISSKTIQTCEVVISNKGNVPIFVNMVGTVSQNDEFCLLTVVDITEIKLAEKAQQQSEECFQLAMKASKDGLFDWNLISNEIYYSPAWKKMLGYSEDELKNEFIIMEQLTHPEDIEKLLQNLKDHLEGKSDHFEMEIRMKHKDGHYINILSRAEAVFDPDGKPIRMVGSHVDISEIKKAENELILYRNQLKELVRERTNELELLNQTLKTVNKELTSKNRELEKYNQLFVGREFRINELKTKLKNLEEKLSVQDKNL